MMACAKINLYMRKNMVSKGHVVSNKRTWTNVHYIGNRLGFSRQMFALINIIRMINQIT